MRKDKKWKHGNNKGAVSADYISRFASEAEFIKAFQKENPSAYAAMGGNDQILKDMYGAPPVPEKKK